MLESWYDFLVTGAARLADGVLNSMAAEFDLLMTLLVPLCPYALGFLVEFNTRTGFVT